MNTILRHLFFGVSLCACSIVVGCGPAGSGPTGSGVSDTDLPTPADSAEGQASKAESVSSAHDHSHADGEDHHSHASATSGTSAMSGMSGMKKMKFPAPADMKFKDEIDSNVAAPKNIGDLVFASTDGSQIKIGDFAGKKKCSLGVHRRLQRNALSILSDADLSAGFQL